MSLKNDRSNAAFSLLRYIIVIPTNNFEDFFFERAQIKKVHRSIEKALHLTHQKYDTFHLISDRIYYNYIELEIQTTPWLDLEECVQHLRKELQTQILSWFRLESDRLWFKKYAIFSKDQYMEKNIEDFFKYCKRYIPINRLRKIRKK